VTEDPDTPTRVLDAAEAAFAEGGYAGARVNAIAENAGANKAMIYYYFESKEGLYRAVLERVFDQIVQAVATHMAATEGADVPRFLAAYRTILRSHPNLARLMMRDLVDGGPHVVEVLAPKLQQIIGPVAGALDSGRRSGRFNPEVEPMIAMPVLVSPFILFAVMSPMLEAATGVPAAALEGLFDRTAEEVLMRGLLARPEEAS
jgi:AcrR family transcriptional regulator